MSSVWQGLPGARGRRSHQMLTEEESGSPGGRQPRPRKPLASSLDTLCARLSRRLPLAALDANFQDGPSWEPLEGPARARGALGSAAQRFQPSCRAAAPTESPHPRRRRGRSARLSGATPPASGLRRLSRWLARDPLHPLRRRSQREAALRSPYASPAPLCSPRQAWCSRASRGWSGGLVAPPFLTFSCSGQRWRLRGGGGGGGRGRGRVRGLGDPAAGASLAGLRQGHLHGQEVSATAGRGHLPFRGTQAVANRPPPSPLFLGLVTRLCVSSKTEEGAGRAGTDGAPRPPLWAPARVGPRRGGWPTTSFWMDARLGPADTAKGGFNSVY
uniref:PICALM interacting mitotic regulator n=2 Tax=Monodelphis domestica TaxID=13616 RepID=A0A5F8GJ80_MONDO